MDADSKMASACAVGQPIPPPQYSVSDARGVPLSGPAAAYKLQQPVMYSSNTSQPQTVVVTQPVYVTAAKAPRTTCAMVMATLSAIFCGFWCGAFGIFFIWKARMHNLKQQYEHARQSLCVAWVFFALAVWFGIIIWVFASIYMTAVLSLLYRY